MSRTSRDSHETLQAWIDILMEDPVAIEDRDDHVDMLYLMAGYLLDEKTGELRSIETGDIAGRHASSDWSEDGRLRGITVECRKALDHITVALVVPRTVK